MAEGLLGGEDETSEVEPPAALVATQRSIAPLWLMGLTNSIFGIVAVALNAEPQ
jgi:hypothetical protein